VTTDARTAIVTGGARGIGAAIAIRLARDGCAVAVVDLSAAACSDTVAAIRGIGGTALAVCADVTNESSVEAAVKHVADELGHPTILVNNAGVIRDNLVHRMSVDDWDIVTDVHMRGSFIMAREAQRHMVEQRHGRIINLSSTSALGNRGQSNYAAAKAGVQGLTKTLAIELGPFGITVNAIAPGFVRTTMTESSAARQRIDADEYFASIARSIPVGRVGVPEDIAHAASFLASEGAGFVSGQVLYVAGGPKG
jgi:3-oxoacyl-[acyl-carrier protein] reductase